MSPRAKFARATKRESTMNNLRLFCLSVFISALLSGCAAPQFNVRQADTRFSGSANALLVSDGNRISSKSIAGGRHIDNRGVFVNPYVEKDAATGLAVRFGLAVVNKASSDTVTGNVNRLGTIKEISFLLDDGRLIKLQLRDAEIASPGVAVYNTIGRYASMEYEESARATVTREQLEQLANAPALSCQIVGSIQTTTYEKADIAPSFQANLRAFLDSYATK